MRLVVIVLIAFFVGGCVHWLYRDFMTGRAEREERDRLLQLVEDYVRAVSANDEVALENLTIGQANLDLSYDISHPRPDFSYPPLVATLRSAVATYGPAEVERFVVEAIGDTTAVGHLITSFADPRHPSERRHITNTGGEVLFKMQDGKWRISGTVL
ncbi:MAG: hypothetical protein PGN27_16710 [Mycolicibacterium neoaurum]|uniref:hypothetical protein n=1 Tax=Mycolicibacterium neoaurum TaxID=1795 RepID=UPI002FFB1113